MRIMLKSCLLILISAFLLLLCILGMYLGGYYSDMHRDDSYYLSIICKRLSIDVATPELLGEVVSKQYDYARDFHLEAVIRLTDEGLACITQYAQKTPVIDNDVVSMLEQCGGMLVLEEFEDIHEQCEFEGSLWHAKWNDQIELPRFSSCDFCLVDVQRKEMLYFGLEW